MKTETQTNKESADLTRRSFLRYAGTGMAAVGLITAASCHKDKLVTNTGIDIGSGDIGILNFAYALEQLEAAFYVQVAASPYSGITAYESSRLTDIRDHEVCHMQFFKAALGASAIQALTPNFSAINFGSRASVLAAAQAFEDTGVAAYNGAGYMIQSATYLGLAGKIVSVEARHAALIGNLITMGNFASSDQVSVTTGLNLSNTPATVLAAANTYLKTKISATVLS